VKSIKHKLLIFSPFPQLFQYLNNTSPKTENHIKSQDGTSLLLAASAEFLFTCGPVGHCFPSTEDTAARALCLSLSISSCGLSTEWLHVIALSLAQDKLLLQHRLAQHMQHVPQQYTETYSE
jgi:hypothetical protein